VSIRRAFVLMLGLAVVPAATRTLQAQSGTYTVENLTDVKLPFTTLDPVTQRWTNQSLNPHMQLTITLQNAARPGTIRVTTVNRGPVSYAVHAGWVYKIAWNSSKRIWDVNWVRTTASAAPVQGVPVQGVPVQGVPLQNAPLQNAPIQGYATQPGTYTVENLTNERLSFLTIDPATGVSTQQALGPHMHQAITLLNASQPGTIQVTTANQGTVNYSTQAGSAYGISWNPSKGVWDLQTIRPAAPRPPEAKGP
jgi:hypothetical protein